MAKVETVYWGLRDDMLSEVSAWDPRQIGIPPRECPYLVMPLGDVDFDTEWFRTKTAAKEYAQYVAAHHGCKAASV